MLLSFATSFGVGGVPSPSILPLGSVAHCAIYFRAGTFSMGTSPLWRRGYGRWMMVGGMFMRFTKAFGMPRLIKEYGREIKALIQDEVRLAKTELSEKVDIMKSN